jgi:hypothetical protein
LGDTYDCTPAPGEPLATPHLVRESAGQGEQLPQGDRPLVRGHLSGVAGKQLGQGRIQRADQTRLQCSTRRRCGRAPVADAVGLHDHGVDGSRATDQSREVVLSCQRLDPRETWRSRSRPSYGRRIESDRDRQLIYNSEVVVDRLAISALLGRAEHEQALCVAIIS